ncbi:hypothetical protein IFM89_036120 [Coptis chinensis]|uniref:Transposase Tnp1/En/Spm-like domain-containing protein n=1 Tax=Coptis chinensis TaxID=261450 RepID=A0A835HQ36_9MAGN|nr:hypothetical protein IFM89_036120 [Coptis chinensis]
MLCGRMYWKKLIFHSSEKNALFVSLIKLGSRKKYELRQVYDKFSTDAERKRNVPVKVKKEEWEAFVDMCSTEEDKTKRLNGKLAREQMKNLHTTGRMGAVPVIEQLKKNSPTGEVSRTEGYVAIHTRRDGSCINFETKQSLVIGHDRRGRVRGLGGGVTKIFLPCLTPYKEIAQREKRARESSESGYEAVMARLDEADKAHKILEDEVADLKRQSSGLGNASQGKYFTELESGLSILHRFFHLVHTGEEKAKKPKKRLAPFHGLFLFVRSIPLLVVAQPLGFLLVQCDFQEIQQSPVRDDSHNIRPQSTTCHLKSFITKTVVALGEICTYLTTPPSSYNVQIDEILDDFAPLYEGDGRLGDIVLGDVIAWPKNYVVFH